MILEDQLLYNTENTSIKLELFKVDCQSNIAPLVMHLKFLSTSMNVTSLNSSENGPSGRLLDVKDQETEKMPMNASPPFMSR